MAHNRVVVQKSESGESSLSLIQKSKQFPQNVIEWQMAFSIFTTVYTKKSPNESNHLVKYGETIRQIANEGGNFNSYDVMFRKLRQVTDLPWHHFHTELYLKASTFIKRGASVQHNNQFGDW